MGKFVLGIVVSLLIIVFGASAYYFGKNSSTTAIPLLKTTNSSTPVITSSPSTAMVTIKVDADGFVNPSATIFAIEGTVNDKKYEDLSDYMISEVVVTLAASECCGSLTKAKTIEQLKYLNSATSPWDFSIGNPIAAQLRSADPNNFPPEAIIGTSANRYVASFELNNVYLIKKITLAADYKLFLP